MKHLSVPVVPHSWCVRDWPDGVYPGRSDKARYIVRAHRTELIEIGALVRIGRELVVMGGPYHAWLSGQGERVKALVVGVNATRQAAAATA